MKPSRVLLTLIFAALSVLLGHRWLALGWNAWHYPTATSAARTQAVVDRGHAYIAAGAEGIEIVDLAT